MRAERGLRWRLVPGEWQAPACDLAARTGEEREGVEGLMMPRDEWVEFLAGPASNSRSGQTSTRSVLRCYPARMRSDLGWLVVGAGLGLACKGDPVGLMQHQAGAGTSATSGEAGAIAGEGGRWPLYGNPSGAPSSGGDAGQGGTSEAPSSGGDADRGGSSGRTSSGGDAGQGGTSEAPSSGGDADRGGNGGRSSSDGGADSGGSSGGLGGDATTDAGGAASGSAGTDAAGSGPCEPLLVATVTDADVTHMPRSAVASTDARACWWDVLPSANTYFLHCGMDRGIIDYDFEVYTYVSVDSWELAVSDSHILHFEYHGSTAEGTLLVRSADTGAELASLDGDDLGAIALDGDVAYFFDWATQSLMEWPLAGGGEPSVLVPFSALDLDPNEVLLATAFGGKLYVAEPRRVTRIDPSTGAEQPVLDFSRRIPDSPALDGTSGSLTVSRRGLMFVTDPGFDDYYVAFSGIADDPQATPFIGLAEALDAQVAPAGCSPGAHRVTGRGTLYSGASSDYYVYPGEGGIFAAKVDEAGVREPRLLVSGTYASVFATRSGSLWADHQEGDYFGDHTVHRLDPSLGSLGW